jgi:uncharacterized protein (TIGR00255 family)
MIRSMTGYGDAERGTAAGRLRAEVRTVNHRYFSANLRLARGLERFEPHIRDALRAHLPRGHVNFSLRLDAEGGAAAGGSVRIDEARARGYVAALRALKDKLDLDGDVDLALLTRFGDVIVPADDAEEPPVSVEDVHAVTEDAARAAVRMREHEGRRLADDLDNRLDSIARALEHVEERAPARLVAERDRMHRVVGELLGNVQLDEERVAREIALMAERLDVSEEIVRMRSHIDAFRSALRQATGEPVGKRLSFLTQEMNREVNTIGSKANDAPIEHEVIAMKEDIERLREQIENIE